MVAIFYSAGLHAEESVDYFQSFDSGSINWTKGMVQSKETVTDEEELNDVSQIDSETINEVVRKLRDNLLKTIYKLRIDSSTLVGEIFPFQQDLHDKIISMVENVPVRSRNQISDGTIELIMEMTIYNGFSQLFLPSEIRHIATINPIMYQKNNHGGQKKEDLNGQYEISEHTGLIVNAKGLNVFPSLAPTIIDENGEQVYGAAFASRNYAVQFGMCAYIKELKKAFENDRAGDNPLVVRGIRATGADIVVSNADASKIRGSSINISFLKECRVVVVLD